MLKQVLLAVVAAAGFSTSSAFAPTTASSQITTALEMKPDFGKIVSASAIASAVLLSNVISPDAALAQDSIDFGSNNVVAARSGGRAGGRSSGGYRPSSSARMAAPRSSGGGTTTIYRTNTIVAPPPVMMGSPYGYSPFAPSPLGIGLGVAGSVGREMREYRQEDQIRQDRSELEMAKQREFALEQRLAQLERAQGGQAAILPPVSK